MTTTAQSPSKPGSLPTPPETAADEPPFGVNEMRLSARQWFAAIAIVLACGAAIPYLWKHWERFAPGPDYRIPYALSKDYWLYQRRLEQIAPTDRIVVLGDSVVWGEYVRPDGTLTHFLNEQTGQADRFVNGGVNGLFPLAMEGLVADYGQSVRGRKVIVHSNVLWMSSPKADLSTDHEETFNHSRLVPQFSSSLLCYRADANERISALLERHIPFFAWTDHLQSAYYDQRSIPQWSLEEDSSDPPRYPNAWRNPLAPLWSGIPSEPAADPQRGPASRRHRPWNARGAQPTHFEWVSLDQSVQWRAFQRVVETLRRRGNDVLVVLGPFNEHMIAEDQRPTYRALRDGIAQRLTQNPVPVLVPETLPSELYADASHPLTPGYAQLAEWMLRQSTFQRWWLGDLR
jgi:hypothetical protein